MLYRRGCGTGISSVPRTRSFRRRRNALGDKPTQEARRRLDQIRSSLIDKPPADPPSGEPLRVISAIHVLQRTAAKDGRDLLQLLADGDPMLSATREARSALDYLRKHKQSK